MAGPREKPNMNTYKMRRAKTSEDDQLSSNIENIPSIISRMPKERFPKRMRPFVPKLTRMKSVMKVETNWAAQITNPVYCARLGKTLRIKLLAWVRMP